MPKMQAAIVEKLGFPPQYQSFPKPIAGNDEALIKVTATSLKQLDRSIVKGTHYSSPSLELLPIVCGTDGVGKNSAGETVYFQTVSTKYGAMAEFAPASLMVKVPETLDDNFVAALINPALGAWLPLAWRAKMVKGETVLIIGATGETGRQAISIAKILGAKKVIVAGRERSGLRSLRADGYINTEQEDAKLLADFTDLVQAGVDVIIDYLWGKPAELMLQALTAKSLHRDESALERGIRYVTVGALAGSEIALPSSVFRSRYLTLLGSGTGNFPPEPILKSMIEEILDEACKGNLEIAYETAPLKNIESLWVEKTAKRLVFNP